MTRFEGPIKVGRRPILQYCSQKGLESRLTRHCRHRVTFLFPNKAAKAASPSGREHRGQVMVITLKANQAKIINNVLGAGSPSTSNQGFAVKLSGQWRMQMLKICNTANAR